MNLSPEALWPRYRDLSYAELPGDVKTVAGHCIRDWFACVLAGVDEPLARILREEFAARDGGPCTLVGTDLRSHATVAALINGATSHALDFDDTNMAMGGHPTAPVFPAALALAEERGASGAELITALVVGIEIESLLGSAIGSKHYAKGWHVTSTMGVFGAAAAASFLLQLNTEQFGHAMGLAASQAGGLKANFGTMTKPFHAGHAAERGLLSARLAARGFTANPEAFSGSQGLVEAAGIGTLDEKRLAATDGSWLIRDTLFKYHAACYLTHAAIESCLQLHTRVDASDLSTATVTVHPSLLDVCAIPRPSTGLEAKFSLTGTTALAILGFDTASPATFVDSIVQQPVLQEMIGRVAVETDPSLRSTQTVVELEDKFQNAFRAEFDSGVPATDLEQQGRKLAAKFDAIALPVLGDDASRFSAGLESLPDLPDVRQLH